LPPGVEPVCDQVGLVAAQEQEPCNPKRLAGLFPWRRLAGPSGHRRPAGASGRRDAILEEGSALRPF